MMCMTNYCGPLNLDTIPENSLVIACPNPKKIDAIETDYLKVLIQSRCIKDKLNDADIQLIEILDYRNKLKWIIKDGLRIKFA